jgi:hypothetical protein
MNENDRLKHCVVCGLRRTGNHHCPENRSTGRIRAARPDRDPIRTMCSAAYLSQAFEQLEAVEDGDVYRPFVEDQQ